MLEHSYLDINLIQFLAITFIMVLGATLQASAGFGSGLLAVPLLVLVDTRLVPSPVLFAYIFLCAFMAWREREHIVAKVQYNLLSGLALGSCLSIGVLLYIKADAFPLIAAIIVLIGVGLSLFKSIIHLNTKNTLIAGTASGMMNTLAGLSGPPMALVMQFESPAFIRSNLAFAFIFASIFSIGILFSQNLFSINDIMLGMILVPGQFLGFAIGQSLSRFLNPGLSRKLVLTLATLSALSLLARSL